VTAIIVIAVVYLLGIPAAAALDRHNLRRFGYSGDWSTTALVAIGWPFAMIMLVTDGEL
jgi:hypothetical protein